MSASSAPPGYRFPGEVIAVAVRWYLRYGLSYRDVEELLGERGIEVDHVTVYRWVQTFTSEFIDAARPSRHTVGDRWFLDETYLKVAGRWVYLYRAVDQYGQVIDVLVSTRPDAAAARSFFARALRVGCVPVEVTTDRAPVYPRVLDELQLPRGTSPTNTRTTAWKPITVGSRHGCGQCADSNDWPRRARSQLGTRSCRICGAATTRSPLTSPCLIGFASPSTNSHPV